MTALRVGIVGAGKISGVYLSTLQRLSNVDVVAVGDLHEARAEAAAATTPRARALAIADLLAADDVDLVLNLMGGKARFPSVMGRVLDRRPQITDGKCPGTSPMRRAGKTLRQLWLRGVYCK